MLRTFCRCKIHRATVTDSSLNYTGSMTLPAWLMAKLDIREGEEVQIANIANGERWTTYAITGKDPKGFCLNGAAARLGQPGDRLIIMVFAHLNEKEVSDYRMKIAHMNPDNTVERYEGFEE